MKFTPEMIKANDASVFERRLGDDMTQAYLTVEDWKMACRALQGYHQLLTVLVSDLDTLEKEHAALKERVKALEARP